MWFEDMIDSLKADEGARSRGNVYPARLHPAEMKRVRGPLDRLMNRFIGNVE